MKFIFVFAHPDDETFSSGGLIAKLVKAGHTVKLITVTYGEAGQLGDPPITTQDMLAHVRKKELECAGRILGIEKIFYLGFKDCGLSKLQDQKLIKPVLSILEREAPDVVITFDKRGGSNHPDHIKTSKTTTLAFLQYQKKAAKHVRLYHTAVPRSYVKKFFGTDVEYTAFGKVRGVPDLDITTVIDISDTFDTKVRAFKCHQTQKKDWQRILRRAKFVDIKKEFLQLISENNLGGCK